MRKIIDGMSPLLKFVLATTLSIGLVAFLFIVGMYAGTLLFDVSFAEFMSRLSTPGNDGNHAIIRYVLVLQTTVLFAFPPAVFTYVFGREAFSSLKIDARPDTRLLWVTMLAILVAIPFINFLGDFNGRVIESILGPDNILKHREDEAEAIVQALLSSTSLASILTNCFVMALMPAIFEELCFRGLLQGFFMRNVKNVHVAVLISGFIFSFVHFQFYGFVPRMLLGMFFGYLFVWGGSLWVPICAHFLNNLTAIIGYSLMKAGQLPRDFDKIGTSDSLLLAGLASGIIVCFMVYKLFGKYHDRVLTIDSRA